jgi:hypothetical protein
MARLVFVCPDPSPQGVGSPGALMELAEHLAGTEFASRHSMEIVLAGGADAERIVEGCDLPIYEVANEARYRDSYELAERHPGLVMLLDQRIPNEGERAATGVPWWALLVRRSYGVLVRNRAGEAYLRGLGCLAPVHVVDWPAALPAPAAAALGEVVEWTVAMVRHPVRRALARWAAALADCGVTVETLALGYGRRYAGVVEAIGDRPIG